MPRLENDSVVVPSPRLKGPMLLRTSRSAPRSLISSLAVVLNLLVAAALLGGCTTTQADGKPREKNRDPVEKFNRGVYKFNDTLDRYALKPAATVYHDYTPQLVQTGVGNFFENLGYPTTIVNQFLQGKFKEGAQDTGRFLLNTTLGWGGLIDVASGGTRLPRHDEDSGQTLGRWGVPPGPYLVLPFLGPATLRDTPARIADDFTQPFRWYNSGSERWFSLGLSFIDKRAQFLPLDNTLARTYDPYAFVRNAYLQRRQYAVYDGNPPEDKLSGEDEDWAEEALRESEEPAADEGDAVEPPADETGAPRRQ
jgi:phospholipid-binding lipoprotein MlaA